MNEENTYDSTIYVNNWNGNDVKKASKPNQITTTRYTWYNFIPLVLFEQFQRISNFYFLVSLVINGLIDSPVPFGLNVVPLVIVILFSMIMRAYEDIKRHFADNEINDQIALVLREENFVNCTFDSLSVGDIVKCENNSPFPADILLMYSSTESNECSVTTVNLDGESNLKTFYGTTPTLFIDDIDQYIKERQLKVQCINPNEDLHKFHGHLVEKDTSLDNKILTEKNLLLRGSCLKNTEFIIGCVIYEGANTKLSLNSQLKAVKLSSVDNRLHWFIIFYLWMQIILSMICSAIWNALYFTDSWTTQHWYIPTIRIAPWKQVEGFLAFYTLFNRIVPISIIFAVYFMKAMGSFFFNSDIEMYSEESDQKARVNTIELLEELGQIEYLFCDKTGTLTENKMKFQRCAIDEREFIDVNNELTILENREPIQLQRPYYSELEDLLMCLCMCHTVKVSIEDGSANWDFSVDVDVDTLCYQASSPDELAFLNATRHYGIVYLGNMKDKHYIKVYNTVETFILREVLPFDSIRKCMSVIVDCADGKTRLICKGAECSLFEMAENTVKVNTFMRHLVQFSEEGLRVLVVGKKIIDVQEVEKFSRELKYYRSSPTLIDRESEIYNCIENKLMLIGVTGVEDKLQDGVPQTIVDLRNAGIKVWIITGDKEETAINISLSAGHISSDMIIHHLSNMDSEESCFDKLCDIESSIKLSPNQDQKYALVIDGKSFSHLIKPEIVSQFVKLCTTVKATLCCRMNPLQKAQAVKMIKENVKPTPITAAIGDGGNDVSMILEANVGIGIFGKEGRQAVRVADYAIVKFSFLRRAILIHGQNLYINMAKIIDFYFYKSFLYTFPLFLFSIYCGFSMLNLYDSMSVSFYNLTYSTLPPLVFLLFNKSATDKSRLQKPYLYRDIQRNQCMTYQGMIMTFFLATIQGAMIFFFVYIIFSMNHGFVDRNGFDRSYLYFGILIFYSIWALTMVRIIFLTTSIAFVGLGVYLFNIIICFAIQMAYQTSFGNMEYWLTIDTLNDPLSWLLIFVIVLACSTIDILLRIVENYKEKKGMTSRRSSVPYTRTY